jgi:hypothetical protein
MTINWKLLQLLCNNEKGGLMDTIIGDLNLTKEDHDGNVCYEIINDKFVEFAEKTVKEEGGSLKPVNELLMITLLVEIVTKFITKGARSSNHLIDVMAESIALCDNVGERMKMTTHAVTILHTNYHFGNKEINKFAHQCGIIDEEKQKFHMEYDEKNESGTMTIKDIKTGKILAQGLFGSRDKVDALSKAFKHGDMGITGDA